MKLELKNISKKYDGQAVLDRLDASFPENGIVGLAGPSGCGKTTLLHIIAGLVQPDAGTIAGLDNKKVSVVFQEDRLLPWLTAAGNLRLILHDDAESEKWLDVVRLSGHGNKFPDEMSGGMKRRLALARGISFGGDIFLLDEPFKGMDQQLKRQIYPVIRELAVNSLIILVSHDPGEINRLCDRILLASGPPLDLRELSSEEFIAIHTDD